jgi:nucleoside 2-deoxyribosyltransferase
LADSGLAITYETTANAEFARHAQLKAATHGITLRVTPSEHAYRFWYLHTLSGGELSPPRQPFNIKQVVEAECVLQFGMVDECFAVNAQCLVYDPQAPADPKSLRSIGSSANRTAIVLNYREASRLAQEKNIATAAQKIREDEKVEVVVVKDGPRGALVCGPAGTKWAPVFVTPRCFLVGSGDVFSAIFAREWGAKGIDPFDAAVTASRATAAWCNSPIFPLQTAAVANVRERTFIERQKPPRVYLAGPFFTAPQLWWVGHSRRVLEDLGFSVFSPYHDVGVGGLGSTEIAKQDLDALEGCGVVFALLDSLDPGTIFEIGYARSKNIPVVCLRTEGSIGLHETMLEGTGCALFDDFGSAAYHAYWAATSSA